jgi:hypothetical protein
LNRCPDTRALLPDYVEGELSGSEARRIAGHLALCSACSREEALYRQSLGALRAAQSEPAPHRDLYAGFEAKLSRYDNRSGQRQLTLRWAGAAACLLLVGSAGASYLRQSFLPTGPAALDIVKPAVIGERNIASIRTPKSVKSGVKPAVPVVKPDADLIVANDRPQSPLDIVTPSGSEQEPVRDPFAPANGVSQRSDHRRSGNHRQDYAADTSIKATSFWHVRSDAGQTAEDIIKVKHQHDSPDLIPGPGKAVATTDQTLDPTTVPPDAPGTEPAGNGGTGGTPAVSALVPNRPENVVVNGKVNAVQTAVGYNAKGRPVHIQVNIVPKAKVSKEGKETKTTPDAIPDPLSRPEQK